MKQLIGICILVSLFCVGGLLAAELEPALENEMATAASDHDFSVIVKLHNPHDMQALDQQLHMKRASKADRHRIAMNMAVRNAEETQGPVLARLDRMKEQGQVVGYTAYWIENLIVVYGNSEAIAALATDPAVESIGYNFKAELIDPIVRGPVRGQVPFRLDNETVTVGHRATGAVRVNHELHITGQGTIIAGLDTGVDGSHPALHDRWRGLTHPHAQCWRDATGTTIVPSDQNAVGHGTHTMGTMTGRRINGTDTLTIGAAPGALWISCNAINMNVGTPLDNAIMGAFQWFADPDGDSTTVDDVPDVIQNSWGVYANIGGDPHYTACFNNWNTAILNCETMGTVVIFSAGNEGPAASSLRSPAKYELNPTQIFSVGAADLSSDSLPPSYPIASFSSRGPSGCPPNTNAIKPEIVAPGVHIYSSLPVGLGSYGYMDGTSMAGPHISGIVALMREACPDCDPQTIKEALINTAVDQGSAGDDNTFGHGFVDAYAAVMSVYSLGRIDGHVTTSGGAPVPGVTVQADSNNNIVVTTDTSGYYMMRTQSAGYFRVHYTKFGFSSVTRDSVQTITGDTTHVNVTMNAVPQGVLRGLVTLQSGSPVVNARVAFPGTPLANVFTDSSGYFVQVMPATNYALHIEFVIPIIPPLGVSLDTTVTVNAGDTTRATFPMFVAMVEPSTADAYGYRAYDRNDRGLPCPYDWINLNPSQGGGGTAFTYPNSDAADFFRAPFPISFYGQLSDTLTVNCNGWMLPGVCYLSGANDTIIPDPRPNTIPGIIAPFWNNVASGHGEQQFMRYDSAVGRWLFQFVNEELTWPANRQETWEVQFRDPAYYPTATGDAEIMFLYGAMGWLSSCTIGIENPARTTGIQVLSDTVLSPWSWPIDNGSAIRFTTGVAAQRGHATVNLTLYPPPANGTPLTIHVGGRVITSTYGATLGADSVPAAPVSAVLTMAGYELGRADRITIAPNGNTNVPVQAWRLDPPRNASGSQYNGAVTLTWNTPQSVGTHANPALRYNVYRDGRSLVSALNDTVFTDQTLPNDSTVSYVVMAVYRYGQMAAAPYSITIDLAAKKLASLLPTVFQLYPNYPNPFNPDTRIRLDVPTNSVGRLEIYDLEGRLVRTLYSGALSAGRYQYSWNSEDEHGRSVASGLYFCRFASPTYTATQKMMLIK